MIEDSKIHEILYGGDYNPEQWSEDIWEKDMYLLKKAGINIVTLNVFSWASIQPSEDVYDFLRLDKIVKLVKDNGLYICLATSTAVHPAWMALRYPDILRTDIYGIKRKFGGRHNSCPNSVTYRTFAPQLAYMLAQHYKDEKNIIAWHVSNEFSGECYCEHCEQEFRYWLKQKYHTIECLNKAWNTSFWGHTFYDWEEIVVPDMRSEHFVGNRTMFQGISLDYRRFMSDSLLSCYQLEYDAIKKVIPDAVITTNLMGFYRELDYQKWAKHMDFIGWDNYPSNEDSYAHIAMAHDLMRGIKQGKPFALMEQTPSVTNWLPYNSLKRPGVMRLWSYQAIAHGADTVMFFQMRRSIGACEKYHGAVIDHVGTENTRVFREIEVLGTELKRLGDQTLWGRTPAKIALIYDWDNWWSVEYSAGPSCELRYKREFERFYIALREMNYDVDIISVDDDLEKYKIVIAPLLYMVKGNDDKQIRDFVRYGGSFVTTFFSGIVQENDLVTLGGYPGKLRDILGIWVEEQDALPHGMTNSFKYKGKTYPAKLICDLLHTENAVRVDDAGYESEFYKGMPVITKNKFGDGEAYYIATASTENFYKDFLKDLCDKIGVEPVINTPKGVEAACRARDNKRLVYLLNHTDEEKQIKLPWKCRDIFNEGLYKKGDEISLKNKDVCILEIE